MSGQPCKNEADVNKFRNLYLEDLNLRAQIDEMNLQANLVYKTTGQLPPVALMADTRTVEQKLLDFEGLKISIIKEISTISNPQFATLVVQNIVQNPLNINNNLLVFTAQRIKEIIVNLSKNYAIGIKGDKNDAEQFVTFITKMYTDMANFTKSTKDLLNSQPTNQFNIVNAGTQMTTNFQFLKNVLIDNLGIFRRYDDNIHNTYDQVVNYVGTLENDFLRNKMVNILNRYRQTSFSLEKIVQISNIIIQLIPETDFFNQIKTYLSNMNSNVNNHDEVVDDARHYFDFLSSGLPNPNNIQTFILKSKLTFDTLERLSHDLVDTVDSKIRTAYDNGREREMAIRYQREHEKREARRAQQERRNARRQRGLEEGHFYEGAEEHKSPVGSEEGSEEGSEYSYAPIEGFQNFQVEIPMRRQSAQGSEVGRLENALSQQSRTISSVSEYDPQYNIREEREFGDIDMELVPMNNLLNNMNDILIRAESLYLPSGLSIEELERILRMKYQLMEFSRQGEFEQGERDEPQYATPSEENISSLNQNPFDQPAREGEVRSLSTNAVGDAQKLLSNFGLVQGAHENEPISIESLNALKTVLREFGSNSAQRQEIERRLIQDLNDYNQTNGTNYNVQDLPSSSGNGLRRRGRPRGKGIIKNIPQKAYKITVKENLNLNKGIEPTSKFIKFGKYLINNHKLHNDDILTLKHIGGGNIHQFPSKKISKNLSNILKTIIGGSLPHYNDLNKLSEAEKIYLHNVCSKSNIIDKLNIPTPNKDLYEKEIHDFEVMKGEIMSGNDNPDLIKKFKILIIRLSRNGQLPKKEVQEILEDLSYI